MWFCFGAVFVDIFCIFSLFWFYRCFINRECFFATLLILLFLIQHYFKWGVIINKSRKAYRNTGVHKTQSPYLILTNQCRQAVISFLHVGFILLSHPLAHRSFVLNLEVQSDSVADSSKTFSKVCFVAFIAHFKDRRMKV